MLDQEEDSDYSKGNGGNTSSMFETTNLVCKESVQGVVVVCFLFFESLRKFRL